MKIVGILGIVMLLLGGLIFLIGMVVCLNTWNSDYASSACKRAEEDRIKFAEAKERCRSVSSDCYRQATASLVSDDDCEARTAFMNKQMLMGIIPAAIGGLLAVIGLFMAVGGFLLGRRKKAVAAT